ncbi:hypothetical protein DFS34DRAFT_654902 [Phlyctochytrium arcticum]|nr:hypothetical protein DFS34DRAFT_654902 [Phlyctochytrium arcticum]
MRPAVVDEVADGCGIVHSTATHREHCLVMHKGTDGRYTKSFLQNYPFGPRIFFVPFMEYGSWAEIARGPAPAAEEAGSQQPAASPRLALLSWTSGEVENRLMSRSRAAQNTAPAMKHDGIGTLLLCNMRADVMFFECAGPIGHQDKAKVREDQLALPSESFLTAEEAEEKFKTLRETEPGCLVLVHVTKRRFLPEFSTRGGFYTTAHLDFTFYWAQRALRDDAAVLLFKISLTHMSTMRTYRFESADSDWQDFCHYNFHTLASLLDPRTRANDVIYGPICGFRTSDPAPEVARTLRPYHASGNLPTLPPPPPGGDPCYQHAFVNEAVVGMLDQFWHDTWLVDI